MNSNNYIYAENNDQKLLLIKDNKNNIFSQDLITFLDNIKNKTLLLTNAPMNLYNYKSYLEIQYKKYPNSIINNIINIYKNYYIKDKRYNLRIYSVLKSSKIKPFKNIVFKPTNISFSNETITFNNPSVILILLIFLSIPRNIKSENLELFTNVLNPDPTYDDINAYKCFYKYYKISYNEFIKIIKNTVPSTCNYKEYYKLVNQFYNDDLKKVIDMFQDNYVTGLYNPIDIKLYEKNIINFFKKLNWTYIDYFNFISAYSIKYSKTLYNEYNKVYKVNDIKDIYLYYDKDYNNHVINIVSDIFMINEFETNLKNYKNQIILGFNNNIDNVITYIKKYHKEYVFNNKIFKS